MIQGGDYSEHKLELDLTVEATTTLTISAFVACFLGSLGIKSW